MKGTVGRKSGVYIEFDGFPFAVNIQSIELTVSVLQQECVLTWLGDIQDLILRDLFPLGHRVKLVQIDFVQVLGVLFEKHNLAMIIFS